MGGPAGDRRIAGCVCTKRDSKVMNFSEHESDSDHDGFVAVRGFLTGEDFTELM